MANARLFKRGKRQTMTKYFFPVMFGLLSITFAAFFVSKAAFSYEGKRFYREWKNHSRVYIYSENKLHSIQTSYVTQDILKDSMELNANYDFLSNDTGLRISFLPHLPIDSSLNVFIVDTPYINFVRLAVIDTNCWGYGIVFAHRNTVHNLFVQDSVLAKSRERARRSNNYAPGKDCTYQNLNYFYHCCY